MVELYRGKYSALLGRCYKYYTYEVNLKDKIPFKCCVGLQVSKHVYCQKCHHHHTVQVAKHR